MSHSISFTRVDSPSPPPFLSPLMDNSQDSSSIPPSQQPPLHHHLLHQQHLLVGSPHLQQQQQPNSTYDSSAAAFHSSSSSVSAAAHNNNMAHHHHHQQQQFQQQNQQFHQQQQSRLPFSSMVNSAPPQLMPSMDYSDGGNVTSPPTADGGAAGAGVGSGSAIEVVKRKRGRPRKYPSDGSATGIVIGGASSNPTVALTETGGGAGDALSLEPPVKKHRGRPPGSGKKQLDALGVAGLGLTPHVILVKAGQDIATEIMAFTQQGPRTVCILTANGAVCNVTLRQPANSGSTLTYEGIFEIISLSGSFLMSENNGGVSRTGGLSVSLARPDGTILGGGVAGMLQAASPVQIIVASFIIDEKKQKSMAAIAPPPNMLGFVNAAATEASPPSQGGGGGASSNSSDENGSPLDHGAYANANANAGQQMQNLPMYSSSMGCWGNTMNMHPN